MKLEEITLRKCRSSGGCLVRRDVNQRYYRLRSPSSSSSSSPLSATTSFDRTYHISHDSLSSTPLSLLGWSNTRLRLTSLLRSFVSLISVPTCRRVATGHLCLPTTSSPSLGRKVTGTLFGHRRGHVTFAVQDDPRSDPVLLVELATSTSTLVKEMSSGQVRIALECDKSPPLSSAARGGVKLLNVPVWTMYCNGRKSGHAVSRPCSEFDWHVLSTIRSVSVGAGVIPLVEDRMGGGGSEGELMYMRARFERIVGSRDSEAYYMLNPDRKDGPELSIFLLRL